jgi:regulatory protein
MARRELSAYDRALRLLTARPRSRSRLEERLRDAGHPAAEVEAALARVTELGYLDDRAFARSQAEALLARFSPRAVELKLAALGLPPQLAAEAVAALQADEPALARSILEKRFGRGPLEGKAAAKAARFLLGRGFDEDLVEKLVGVRD